MPQTLFLLVQMQAIDDEIGKKQDMMQKLPRQLHRLKEAVKNAQESLQEVKKKLEENAKAQKSKNLEIDTNNDQIAKYENQLITIKTNKEFKALNHEVSHLKEKNSKIDDQILELMEVESTLKKEREQAEAELKRASDELSRNEERLNREIQVVEQEIEQLKQQRKSLGVQLPRSLANRYVNLIRTKERKAVVFADPDNESCTGCGFKIRPQMMIEVSKGNRVIYCENCGRIVVKKPANEA